MADLNDLNKDRFYAQSVSASINISNLLIRQITLKDVVITGVALDKQRTTKAELYINTKSLALQQSKISSEVVKQQAIETVGKVGEKLQQVDFQKLKENTKQAKDIANGIKQMAEFLSNFSSKNYKTGEQAVQGITSKAEAKVYGYANIHK